MEDLDLEEPLELETEVACFLRGSIWWRELVAVPEVGDHKKLAQEVQASFQLPRGMSELHKMEDCHQAPPVPLCLH